MAAAFDKCDCCRHKRATGWSQSYCQPCVFTRIDPRAYAIYELMMACVRVTPIPIGGGMGGGSIHTVMELSSENLCSKLRLHGIDEGLYADLDDLVTVAFDEYRRLSNEKTVSFDPTKIQELGEWRIDQ